MVVPHCITIFPLFQVVISSWTSELETFTLMTFDSTILLLLLVIRDSQVLAKLGVVWLRNRWQQVITGDLLLLPSNGHGREALVPRVYSAFKMAALSG